MDASHGRRVRLGPGGEFDLIRTFGSAARLPEGVLVGPGDDCAVLDAGRLALTTDMAVEDVHFRRSWMSAGEVGWRAGAAALSDLAAVGAEPLAVLVSLAVSPEDALSGWAGRLMAGLHGVVGEAGAAIVGGDLTRSPGPVIVDVTAIGRVEAPLLRDGARPGDEVWVTGSLGGAGGALVLLRAGSPLPEPLRRAFARPVPRWREARWLRRAAEVHAAIDLSDGLAGDAGHLAAASAVAVELDPRALPLAPGLEAAAPSAEESVRLALHAGEDYELCVVAPPGALEPLAEAFRDRFGVALTRVGRIREGKGVWALEGEGPPRPLGGGFSHFDAPSVRPPADPGEGT